MEIESQERTSAVEVGTVRDLVRDLVFHSVVNQSAKLLLDVPVGPMNEITRVWGWVGAKTALGTALGIGVEEGGGANKGRSDNAHKQPADECMAYAKRCA